MEAGQFSNGEISAVACRYPTIHVVAPGILEGPLLVDALYGDTRVTDTFEVRITSANPHSDLIPALYEIGGRTKAIGDRHRITDLRDLHRNFDGAACLCVKQDEKKILPRGSTLIEFIEKLVVPYLYALNYFDQHRVWPWTDYSHGALGLLEYYADNSLEQIGDDADEVLAAIRRDPNWKQYDKQFRRPSANRGCLCGSNKSFATCHNRAWMGMGRMRAELDRLGFKLRHILNA